MLHTLAALSEISIVISLPSSSTLRFCNTVVACEAEEREKGRAQPLLGSIAGGWECNILSKHVVLETLCETG